MVQMFTCYQNSSAYSNAYAGEMVIILGPALSWDPVGYGSRLVFVEVGGGVRGWMYVNWLTLSP